MVLPLMDICQSVDAHAASQNLTRPHIVGALR